MCSSDITNRAWEMTGSYVLTGEAASDRNVRPRVNFDPTQGHWGALQVLGRYTELSVDQEIFNAGLAAAGASRKPRSFTAAANWYPHAVVKYHFTFERTMFDAFAGGADRASENRDPAARPDWILRSRPGLAGILCYLAGCLTD